MLERTLIELADENLSESHREFSRWHDNGLIHEEQGLLLTRGADRFAGVNFAMRTRPDEPAPGELITRSQAFFRGTVDGFAIRTRAHCDADLIAHCKALELLCVGESPGLVLDEPLAEEPMPANVRLAPVRDATTAADLADVSVRAYQTMGLPPVTGAKMFHRTQRLLSPHLHAVLAYLDGKAVSGALVLMSHRIGGVYWVGTVPEARGHGLAAHVTRAVGNWAFDHGAAAVVLQASKQGGPLYLAMGYREFSRYPWYLCPTDAVD